MNMRMKIQAGCIRQGMVDPDYYYVDLYVNGKTIVHSIANSNEIPSRLLWGAEDGDRPAAIFKLKEGENDENIAYYVPPEELKID